MYINYIQFIFLMKNNFHKFLYRKYKRINSYLLTIIMFFAPIVHSRNMKLSQTLFHTQIVSGRYIYSYHHARIIRLNTQQINLILHLTRLLLKMNKKKFSKKIINNFRKCLCASLLSPLYTVFINGINL